MMAPFCHSDSGSRAGTQICRFQIYIQPLAIAKARIAAGISSYSTFSQNLVKAPLSPITGLLG